MASRDAKSEMPASSRYLSSTSALWRRVSIVEALRLSASMCAR